MANGSELSVSCENLEKLPVQVSPDKCFPQVASDAKAYWNRYWKQGGIVDFGLCKDPRARELERRVVLSQYLLAILDA